MKHFLTGPMSEKKCSNWYLLVSRGTLPTCRVLHVELVSTVMSITCQISISEIRFCNLKQFSDRGFFVIKK